MRLDQWLWAVRVFKSRTLAGEAIRSGRVLLDGVPTKPAHEVHKGEVVTIRFWNRERLLRIRGSPPSRIPAKLVSDYVEEYAPFATPLGDEKS